MSYNWISAADAKGRERLEELAVDKRQHVPIRDKDTKDHGYAYFSDRGAICINGQIPASIEAWHKMSDRIEFLDPEPPKPQADENGLLRCPHCGGKGKFYKDWHELGAVYSVRCMNCDCATGHFDSKESCSHVWNRRA